MVAWAERMVGIIALSALILGVFVYLNPAQRQQAARNDRRANDALALVTAIHQYANDHKGTYPDGLAIGMAETQIGTSGHACAISIGGCAVVVDSCVDLTEPFSSYIKSIPVDPDNSFTAAHTGYSVKIESTGVVTVKSCGVEGRSSVVVSK